MLFSYQIQSRVKTNGGMKRRQRDRSFVFRFMWNNWLEREKEGSEKVVLTTFSSQQGGAMGDVLEWEIFSDAEQRHISMDSNKPLDWLCAESNKLCCKERKTNVYFNVQSNFYLLKHFEEYLILSELFFSMICLKLNFLWFQAALWTQHMLHTSSWYAQVFFNHLIK